MQTITISVKGMTCGGCVNSVTKALSAVKGVEKVDVRLEQNQATVTFDEAQVTKDTLRLAVEDAGYDVG